MLPNGADGVHECICQGGVRKYFLYHLSPTLHSAVARVLKGSTKHFIIIQAVKGICVNSGP